MSRFITFPALIGLLVLLVLPGDAAADCDAYCASPSSCACTAGSDGEWCLAVDYGDRCGCSYDDCVVQCLGPGEECDDPVLVSSASGLPVTDAVLERAARSVMPRDVAMMRARDCAVAAIRVARTNEALIGTIVLHV